MPTDFYLVASNDVDRDYVPPPGRDSSYQPAAVYLKNTVGIKELNASKWIIMSRYKLREDGDIVRINDFIVLKSVQYKTKCLSSFEINTSSPKSYDQLVGLADESIAFSKQGFQLLMLRAAEIEKDDKEDSNGEKGNGDIDKKNSDGNKGLSGADGDTRTIVYTGDYIRISHKEKAGHFITRVDDEDIMSTGVISLLGSICKKQEMSKSEAQAVYVRSFDAQKPLRPCDFPTPATCTGIWQIMPVDLYSDYSLHGPAIYGLKIRLRHTLSGQYLCIRQLTSSDTPALQSSYQELDANMQAVSQTNRLESNFDLKFTTPKKLTKKWVVATSDEPDNQTIFTICQLDVTSESDNIVNYNEIIYFKHNATKLRLQVSNNSEDGDQSVWWEYDGDSVITVDSSNLDTVLASNVCILEKVAIEEVQDVLFVNKLLPLARATTTMMQLSPRSKDLCIPMFRHFFKLLQTTVLWLLGHSDGDGSLAGQASLVESGNTNQAPALSRILYKWAMQDENDDETESAKPQSLFSLSYGESKDEGDVKLDRTKEQFDEISTVDTPIHEERFVSAMAPWLGRGICTDSDDGCAKRLEDVEVVDASNSTAKLKLKHFVDHNLPSNTLIMRRQTILAESRFLEILLKFLNVVLLLDKRYSDAIGVEIKDKSFPSIVTNCCLQIHDVLNATVIRNEKIAFKLMSLHGTLYSMINQILIGWMPPLTTILELTCSDDTGMAMEKQGKSEASNIIKNMTSIMINAISAGDLRRVVTQLIKLKNIADSRAQNILQLLTILCSSGMSNKYFQDILVNCISSLATVTESDLAMEQRRTCAQEDCILFYSRLGDNNQWEISFATTGLMPPVEELNQNVIEEKARREANNLKLLFESYNDSETEDDLLDIGECFNFMEDLVIHEISLLFYASLPTAYFTHRDLEATACTKSCSFCKVQIFGR